MDDFAKIAFGIIIGFAIGVIYFGHRIDSAERNCSAKFGFPCEFRLTKKDNF